MPYSIMLDAGHGGKDPGAVYNGRKEAEDSLKLALIVGEILQNRGIDVEYTRTTDIYESPFQKVTEANEAKVDFFISIHRNSSEKENTVSGIESLVYQLSGIKYEMAENINEQLESVGFVNRGVKERPNLIVLKRTNMPAILIEVGFINSEIDNQLFENNFYDIAAAIADGILDTLHEPEDDMVEYRVQVGAFKKRKSAEKLLKELLAQEYPAFIEEENDLYKVQVGDFDALQDAVAMEKRLKMAGYSTIIIR